MNSIDVNEPLNELGLKLIAEMEERQLIIKKPDGTEETIGKNTGKPPLYYYLEDSHYMPMIKNSDGKFEVVNNLENKGKSCGYESALYLLKREQFLSKNYWPEEADIKAREFLKNPNIREIYLASVVKNALNNQHLQDDLYGRSQEARTDLEGGAKPIQYSK